MKPTDWDKAYTKGTLRKPTPLEQFKIQDTVTELVIKWLVIGVVSVWTVFVIVVSVRFVLGVLK